MDDVPLSAYTLDGRQLVQADALRLRIGTDPDSQQQGGLRIFGHDFGNYPQGIRLTCYFSQF